MIFHPQYRNIPEYFFVHTSPDIPVGPGPDGATCNGRATSNELSMLHGAVLVANIPYVRGLLRAARHSTLAQSGLCVSRVSLRLGVDTPLASPA